MLTLAAVGRRNGCGDQSEALRVISEQQIRTTQGQSQIVQLPSNNYSNLSNLAQRCQHGGGPALATL